MVTSASMATTRLGRALDAAPCRRRRRRRRTPRRRRAMTSFWMPTRTLLSVEPSDGSIIGLGDGRQRRRCRSATHASSSARTGIVACLSSSSADQSAVRVAKPSVPRGQGHRRRSSSAQGWTASAAWLAHRPRPDVVTAHLLHGGPDGPAATSGRCAHSWEPRGLPHWPRARPDPTPPMRPGDARQRTARRPGT